MAPLLRCLRAQTICDRIEIVIVTPATADLGAGEALLDGFASWKAVPVPAVVSMSEARAMGVRAASCPYVVFTEDHCFPERDWAASLLDAFERHAADAVGPVFVNANPGLALSWTFFILEYGHWMAPHAGGWMDHLPGHNSAYRRELLLALGDDLARAIEAESALHFEWWAQGRRLWLEPQARVHHVNITNAWAALAANCAYQRLWAH
ncbi:MAG: glycosyltransferase, partial [Burkholderiales bacterium]